jgi:hypothetical protein
VQKGILHILYFHTISLICTVFKLCCPAHLFPNTPRICYFFQFLTFSIFFSIEKIRSPNLRFRDPDKGALKIICGLVGLSPPSKIPHSVVVWKYSKAVLAGNKDTKQKIPRKYKLQNRQILLAKQKINRSSIAFTIPEKLHPDPQIGTVHLTHVKDNIATVFGKHHND